MALILKDLAISLSGKPLIRPFSLEIADGEIVTLMGPSGCGKSSVLGFIAGDIEQPLVGSGSVILNSRSLDREMPERRGIGRLFQDDLLFPHMTVGENILFGMPRGDRESRLAAMRGALIASGLEGLENRPPFRLSGGQRARVALLRALMAKPDAMLLDEPFNKLDTALRDAIRSFVFGEIAERGIPCLLVTHDRADVPAGGRVLIIGEEGRVSHA